jgi:hypothetical protein
MQTTSRKLDKITINNCHKSPENDKRQATNRGESCKTTATSGKINKTVGFLPEGVPILFSSPNRTDHYPEVVICFPKERPVSFPTRGDKFHLVKG